VSYGAAMAIPAGRYEFGTDRGRITLRTSRDGFASQAGHDLVIVASRWSAQLTVSEDLRPAGLEARVDLGALTVREGTGGLKPLTDRDKREIAVTARKVLGADRNPEAVFSAAKFEPDTSGGGTISGTLTLAGQSRPLSLQVTATDPDRYRATATIVQTEFGIKPYTAFLGSLKVRDAVEVEIEADLSDLAQSTA
ncbi:MAG: YceI family protein, partial [Streptosporangiaceae bacterium]